jgi:S1-C subfamily serine protease
LGIRVEALSAESAQAMKLDAGTRGVRVTAILVGGPAQEAGLGRGDVIVAVNGKPIATEAAMSSAIAAAKSGDIVTLTVLRVEANNSRPSEVGRQHRDPVARFPGLSRHCASFDARRLHLNPARVRPALGEPP